MSTKEIAEKLVDYCRHGKYQECYQELYSPDCVSIEPQGALIQRAEGLEEMAEKGKKWNEMIEEVHGGSVGDPIVASHHFSCTMSMDCTFKEFGRQQFDQICVYEVKGGKIVLEQFFYPAGFGA